MRVSEILLTSFQLDVVRSLATAWAMVWWLHERKRKGVGSRETGKDIAQKVATGNIDPEVATFCAISLSVLQYLTLFLILSYHHYLPIACASALV